MIDNFQFKEKYNVYDLVDIIRLLRSEGGCPWDIVQTHESIRKSLIEETYETIEAINKKSIPMLREELGDVLMQVIFHAQIETENGNFNFDDVADENAKKMIERHPHVFGETTFLLEVCKTLRYLCRQYLLDSLAQHEYGAGRMYGVVGAK